jgi:hypothetical protein
MEQRAHQGEISPLICDQDSRHQPATRAATPWAPTSPVAAWLIPLLISFAVCWCWPPPATGSTIAGMTRPTPVDEVRDELGLRRPVEQHGRWLTAS